MQANRQKKQRLTNEVQGQTVAMAEREKEDSAVSGPIPSAGSDASYLFRGFTEMMEKRGK
jgi:hypothetical protein